MKIVQINTIFPYGSTGKIVNDIENYCKNLNIRNVVLYGHGIKSYEGHYKICSTLYMKFQALRSRITGIMYGGCFFSTLKAIRIIENEKPDIVHIHCINGNMINIFKLISYLKKNKIRTVITNHAELYYTANCGHSLECNRYLTGCGKCPRLKKETKSWFFDGTHRSWIKMKKAFDGFNHLIVVNVSPWLTKRASTSTILKNFKHVTILNGIDTSIFYYKNNYVKKQEKLIFQTTANFSDDPNDIKGGFYLIKLAKMFENKNVKFVVAGKYSAGLSVPSNMILLGQIFDQNKLAELYSQADLFVLTSKKETFSMVTIESLCCGTPVVGFNAGAPEEIAIDKFSKFVKHGDIEAMYNAIIQFLNSNFDKEEISQIARKKYSREQMSMEYLEIYKELIN